MNRPALAIAGGGPVGLALAGACAGFDTTVIEASAARAAAASDEFDLRVYSVSPGTRDLLRRLGAWSRLDARRVVPVRGMEIFGDREAKLTFAAPAAGALAWIVEAGRLADALEAHALSLSNVKIVRGRQLVAAAASAAGGWAELEGGERIEASLLVGADGPDSKVRSLLGIAFDERPYDESAIVANFDTGKEHAGVARQWFRADGVLAWLPLPGKRISIVWSAPTRFADEIAALEPPAFERRVREAGGAALGDLRLASAVARFPLRFIRVPRPVAPGAALVGDAAHAVHPLAGQGVNLGFQDARSLAAALAQRSPLERPGDLRVLRRYARSRSEDVAAMQVVTHGLDRLFAADEEAIRGIRNLGLGLVDRQPWAKSALARRAMR
jgi:2-octaprenylphenol hydroxylase